MSKQVILRPVYNRPEMLHLSIEYEMLAREYHSLDNFKTLFLVEAGTPQEVLDIIQKYPGECEYAFREKRYGLTVTILEGMKQAFKMTDDYVVYIEDDILVHETYFKFMDVLLNMPEIQGKYSVLSPFCKKDDGNINHVFKRHHYAALAPLIPKQFHTDYILPHSILEYYQNEPGFIHAMDKHFAEKGYREKGYKYDFNKLQHTQQAGLHNRAVDLAMIEEDKWVINPCINRQQHIGFYGANRGTAPIAGDSFEERVETLRDLISSPEKLYDATPAKCYNDYTAFRSELDNWDMMLELVENG